MILNSKSLDTGRITAVTNLVNAGFKISDIQDVTNHKQKKLIQIYKGNTLDNEINKAQKLIPIQSTNNVQTKSTKKIKSQKSKESIVFNNCNFYSPPNQIRFNSQAIS